MSLSLQEHGGRAALDGWETLDILDLSVNVNPYGPPPGLREHLLNVAWQDYPDPHVRRLREALAQRWDWPLQGVLVGNGANELFWAIARSALGPKTRFATLEPCYSEFTRAAKQTGSTHRPLSLAENDPAGFNFQSLSRHIAQEQVDLLYLCNPHSLTGLVWDEMLIADVAREHPKCLLVLDQSFRSLSTLAHIEEPDFPPHVIRVSSMTKDFALAGLRLGYLLADESRCQKIQAEIPTWSVNALAQTAGLWCLHQSAFLATSCQQLLEDRLSWEHEFTLRGYPTLPSSTIFFMLRIPDAVPLAERLLSCHQILVRSCQSYAWPNWWRLAARPLTERIRFFQAFDKVIA